MEKSGNFISRSLWEPWWDVTVGRTTVGDILRSKEKWMSHERSGRAAKIWQAGRSTYVVV